MLTPNTKRVLLDNLNFCFEGMYNENDKKFLNLEQDDFDWYNQTFQMKHNILFMEYFNIVGFPPVGNGAELYNLDQIIDDYNEGYWINRSELIDKYPNASKRYLQITSIEGGGSYFYDKETDYVYDVDWGQEEDMITGKLKPWFTSFYDFLEWYYSEEEEEVNSDTSKTIEINNITLVELAVLIPWAGLKSIDEYNNILTDICSNEEFKEYKYLFEDIEYSANEEKLKYTKLPINLVSIILDKLGMIVFYRANSNTLSSLSYEQENRPRLAKEWAEYIRANGYESVMEYNYEDETILKTSYALLKYGYEIIEKVYERTNASLDEV